MEMVSSLVSLTVAKVLKFSGLDNRNVLRTKKMEEKALEVYGEWVSGCVGRRMAKVQVDSSKL